MRNKTIDLSVVRQKNNLVEDSAKEFEAVAVAETEQFVEFIAFAEEIAVADISLEETAEERKTKAPVVFEKLAAPKLLNPTIHPKIINLNRMKLFKCDFCSHTTSTMAPMERHMKQIHITKASTSFTCKICLKTFGKKNILQNHEKIHMTQRPTFECQHCGKVLSSQTAVSNHIKWIHKESREFECKSCSKKFATVRELEIHH